MDTQWIKLLEKTKALDIVRPGQKIVSVSGSTKMKEVMEILKTNNILGVAIMDSNRIFGFVDTLDICSFALHLWRKYDRKSRMRQGTSLTSTETETGRKFFEAESRDVLNFAKPYNIITVPHTSTLKDVFVALSEKSFKPHRVAIVNEKHEPLSILTQSDINNFAMAHINLIPLNDRPIKAANLIKSPLMIRTDAYLSDALSMLTENSIFGMPVVDWENKLAANFSASDLKGGLPKVFGMLDKSVLDFLRNGTTTKSKMPPVSCTVETNLGMMITTLSKEKLHRMFVVNDTMQLVGIITLTDLMQFYSEGLFGLPTLQSY